MNQLVFRKNDQILTSSRNVARDFKKEHRVVLKAIDDLLKEGVALNNADLFYETTYIHEQNKQKYREYLMNRDGFTLLVMGFTGKEALKFKLDYMNAFNEMEKELQQPKVLSNKEQLIAAMKLSLESNERLDEVEKDVSDLKDKFENELSLTHGQAVSLNHAVKKRVEKLWSEGIKGTLETKQQMYRNLYSQLYRAFQAPTYREVRRKDFEDAMRWVEAWRPL